MIRALILRHSFSNPLWWWYQFHLAGYHMRYNNVRY
jgi:hypothetical protein